MIITYRACDVSSCSQKGEGREPNPSISSLYNKILPSLPPLPYPIHIDSPTSSITVSLTPSMPFPNSYATLLSLHTLPYTSSPYNSAHLIGQCPPILFKFPTHINAPHLPLHLSHILHTSHLQSFYILILQ